MEEQKMKKAILLIISLLYVLVIAQEKNQNFTASAKVQELWAFIEVHGGTFQIVNAPEGLELLVGLDLA